MKSKNQRPINIVSLFGPVVLHPVVPIGPEVIKPQAVCFRVDDLKKPAFEGDKLRGVHLALENRVLHPLAIVETGFRCPA